MGRYSLPLFFKISCFSFLLLSDFILLNVIFINCCSNTRDAYSSRLSSAFKLLLWELLIFHLLNLLYHLLLVNEFMLLNRFTLSIVAFNFFIFIDILRFLIFSVSSNIFFLFIMQFSRLIQVILVIRSRCFLALSRAIDRLIFILLRILNARLSCQVLSHGFGNCFLSFLLAFWTHFLSTYFL